MTTRAISAMGGTSSLNAPDTNNATWFDYTEKTDGHMMSSSEWYKWVRQEYYKHLAEINRGRKRGAGIWNDPYHTYQSNRDLIRIISSQLDLSSVQRDEAEDWFLSFDLERWGVRKELVAYCLCAWIVHNDGSERKAHPDSPDDEKPDQFVNLPEQFGLRKEDLQKVYGKIGHHLRNESQSPARFDRRGMDDSDSYRATTPADEKPWRK